MNSNLLQYLLESGVCLAAFYLLDLAVLRKETSFQYNRFFLLAAALLSFVLPLLEVRLLPQQTAETFRPITSQLEPMVIYATAGTAAASGTTTIDWRNVLRLIYISGCCFFAYRLLRQVYRLLRYIRQHKPEQSQWQGIKLLKTNGELPTFSFLNYIFWDNSQPLDHAEREQVMRHEAVHVQQRHSYDMLYLEMLQIIFWFNPLLLLYKKALVSTHEFIADAQVLQTADNQAYAHLLAKQVCLKMELALGNYFNTSLTLKRMKMIQTTNSPTPLAKKLMALPLLALLLLVFSCDPLAEETDALQEVTLEEVPLVEQIIKAPEFTGGEGAMMKHFQHNVRYPAYSQRSESVGHVVMQVTIDETGKLRNFKTIQAPEKLWKLKL